MFIARNLGGRNGLKKAICETSDPGDNNGQHDININLGNLHRHVLSRCIRLLLGTKCIAKISMKIKGLY